MKIDVSRLIKVRGLPWTTTKTELRNFFSGIKIMDGVNGIYFIADDRNNIGVAYIRMASKKDFDRAKEFNRKNLDGRYVDGKITQSTIILLVFKFEKCFYFFPIAVLPATNQDLMLLKEHISRSNDDNILRLEGLPWTATKADIGSFFKGLINIRHFFDPDSI